MVRWGLRASYFWAKKRPGQIVIPGPGATLRRSSLVTENNHHHNGEFPMTEVIYAKPCNYSRPVNAISRADLTHAVASLVPNRADREVYLSVLKWYDRAKYIDETGRKWLIRTAAEFITDGVLYTEATIRRALRRLAKAGLLVLDKGRHLYRKRRDQTRNCSWISLPDSLPACETEHARHAHSKPEQNMRATHVPIFHVEQERSYTSNRVSAETCLPRPEKAAAKRSVLPGWGIRVSKKIAKAMTSKMTSKPAPKESSAKPRTAAEVAAHFADRRRPDVGNALTSHKLHRVFATAYAAAFEGERAGEPQAKHLKQWKDFIAKARTAGLTDPQICEAVEAVTSAWQPFGQWLHERNGWRITARPTPVAFYQQNAEVVNYHRVRVLDAVPEQETPTGGETLADWLQAKAY